MSRVLRLVIGFAFLSAFARAGEIVEYKVKTKAAGIPEFTLLLRQPDSGAAKGVVCLSILGSSVKDIRERIENREVYRHLIDWAESRDYALVAWGSRTIWDPHRNWNEQAKKTARKQDARFDALADGWERGMLALAKQYNLPTSGYFMHGISGAGQFALRLALRKPGRFLAVHAHVASSFDEPPAAGKTVLWCVTTGENEAGYARSREFFTAARAKGYPLVYKAYPGLGHVCTPLADHLGLACFEYAASRAAEAKDGRPDWQAIFAKSPYVADIVNQLVARRENENRLPPEFRMLLPAGELVNAWRRE